jgi:hypothetical protein
MDIESCGAVFGAMVVGLGIDALVAWGIAAIWSLPFWPVFLTVILALVLIGLATAGK